MATQDSATATEQSMLGTLGKLPVEVRNNIYSWLRNDEYKQVYQYHQGSFHIANGLSSKEPSHLNINDVLRKEMLGGWTADRYFTVRIEEHPLITNFPMHDPDNNDSPLAIPACKRIVITIDPPSPRDGLKFYKMRERIQSFVRLINRGARSVNPQVSIELDRRSGRQVTRQYNDFAILFGPFVELDSRCKAVMVFRTTGFDIFMPKVESYCALVEAAMSFDQQARDELKSHQYQIDIRSILSHLTSRPAPPILGMGQVPTLPLSDLDTQTLKHAVAGLLECHEREALPKPVWLVQLSHHLRLSNVAKLVPKSIYTAAMGGYTATDMQLWASGFITTVNPFFDDQKFFHAG